MKFIKDTQKMHDANEFGEALREYCFVPEGKRGCYETFDLREEFKPIKKTCGVAKTLLKHLGLTNECTCNGEHFNPGLYSNGTIHIGWYWDGDGILCIIEGNKIIVNSDCKTDYCWEWE